MNAPNAVFTMGLETLHQLFVGGATAADLIADGLIGVDGDGKALARSQALFAPPPATN